MSEVRPVTPSIEKDKLTPIAQRYHGAWLEYNTRIQARTSLTNTFLTVSLGLLSAIYGDIPKKIAPVDAQDEFLKMLIFSMPVASIIFATLLLMHDAMMGCLANYMKVCELQGDPIASVPAYHADPYWSERFLLWRSLQQLSAIFVITAFCLAAFYRVADNLSAIEKVTYFMALFLSLALTGGSIYIRRLWMDRKWRGMDK